jgi:hypothetical protein
MRATTSVRAISLALILAGISLTVTVVPAAASGGGNHRADAAKRKCKKARKGSKAKRRAAKRRCRRKKIPPAVTPAGVKTTRALLSWPDASDDLDLYAVDTGGNVAYSGEPTGIPNAVLEGTGSPWPFEGFGTESFSDFDGTSRQFAFVVCYFDSSASSPAAAGYTITLDGVNHSGTLNAIGDDGDIWKQASFPAVVIPAIICG